MRTPTLPDLEAFVAVARHRSFRRAAAEREVSASLLSQTVSRLEDQLGVRLLNRTTRSVSLTEAGEELLAGLTPAFAGISEALERVNGFRRSLSGTLRLNAPLPVAHLLLAPMVAQFLSEHPAISVELATDDAFVDTVKDGFDAGFRFGESLANDMIAVRLGPPQRMVVVVSPKYLDKSDYPKTPSDLIGKDLIRHRFPGGLIYPWEFESEKETITVVPTGPLTVNDPHVKIRAAVDGAGYAFEFEDYARAALDRGELVKVLEDWCPEFPGPYLYYSSRKHMPSALRAFIDFAKRQFATS